MPNLIRCSHVPRLSSRCAGAALAAVLAVGTLTCKASTSSEALVETFRWSADTIEAAFPSAQQPERSVASLTVLGHLGFPIDVFPLFEDTVPGWNSCGEPYPFSTDSGSTFGLALAQSDKAGVWVLKTVLIYWDQIRRPVAFPVACREAAIVVARSKDGVLRAADTLYIKFQP